MLDLTWFIQHQQCIYATRWRHECLSWADASTSSQINPISLEVLLYHISPLHPWPARSSPESRNFPVQRLFRNAYFIHSRDMTKPSHPSFSDHLLKTYLSCSYPYFFICDFVSPGDTKNASQPPVVCCFQFLAQCDGKRPYLCAIEKSRQE